MFIDVNQIGLKGLLLENSIDLDPQLLIEEGSTFLEPVKYKIQFVREGEKILTRGIIQTAITIPCVNCLETFEMKVESNFDIILFPAHLLTTDQQALSEHEMEYIFFEGDEIDLEKLLMEQINLSVPYNPSCSEDCRGICPVCGKNSNYEPCHCREEFAGKNTLFNNI